MDISSYIIKTYVLVCIVFYNRHLNTLRIGSPVGVFGLLLFIESEFSSEIMFHRIHVSNIFPLTIKANKSVVNLI